MNDSDDQGVRVRLIKTPTVGRYLVGPAPSTAQAPVLVGFHGYGETAEVDFERLRRVPGSDRWLIVAVQSLHRFYRSKTQEVVGSWMTRMDREQAIADNIRYVDSVMAAVAEEYAVSDTTVYTGFSQGVAMAYRAGLYGARATTGVALLAGDVPPDLKTGRHREWPRVLLGRGADDPWYTQARMDDDLAFLRAQGTSTETSVFDGGHEWTEPFTAALARFLVTCLSQP